MIPGISTACFYPQYTEQSLQRLVELPVQSVEVFINCSGELEMQYCRQLRSIAQAGGTKILSIHPYTSGMEPMYFFSTYDRRFAEGMEVYRRFFEAAAFLGAQIVVFHGNIRQSELPYAAYFERYAILLQEARRFGVELCHENVSRCAGYHPDFFRELSKALPDAGFVLDVKQTIRAGFDPFVFLEAMGSGIKHVHISDHDLQNDCLAPGKGIFNMDRFLSCLHEQGYDRGVIVELYRENFGTFVEISEGYQHLCSLISTGRKT